MRKVAIAATVLSFALVGSASAQQAIATDPFTGAVTGANAAAAQGAAAAGPLGALVAAPLGLAAGVVTGTLGAVGTVAGAVTGAPTYGTAPVGYNYCPAGYTPYSVAGNNPAITGVGYCTQATSPVAFSQPVTTTGTTSAVTYTQTTATRVAYARPQRTLSRTAAVSSRRALTRQVASRTAPAYRRVGFRTGPAVSRYRRVGFRSGPAHGRMASMYRARTY